jgi:maltose alpha-D-glucosyltransferase/alpha-amylase
VPKKVSPTPEKDTGWYKDAVIYELHVRAFYDSDGDGIGDLAGLAEKLDYLQDLGVTAIWLLPFYPSPLKDDGYDIADYVDIHPSYGTLRDMEVVLREAHRRGLRVITELVLNHTSDRHPWFQRARRARPGSTWRNFYVWTDTPATRYSDARIIFKDFEASNWTWDPLAKAYYWHRFYSHQPDLNFDNPAVRRAILQVVSAWLRLGVDGLRLDAVPYLYERDGTNCENLPETHAFLRALRQHVDKHFGDRMLLAEANQWPEDAAAYFGQGDECHMAFHFPLMPRLFMSIHMEDAFPISDILDQTPAIPDNCQWALFLRNHDELTLEMVTDEERDYMYRTYAKDRQARINLGIRRRLAPLLGNHRRKIELMNGLLLSLPGTPVIYYGDEIGMGDNIYLGDRNGVRTPMQWSADRNVGFSRANPQRLYLPIVIDPEYHPDAVNVEEEQNNLHSLLWWMKRLISLRKRSRAFGRGTIEFLYPENRRVCVFVRAYGDERILVVANLSRFVQYVELDLSAYRGFVPVELFGNMAFPPIGELPYFLTLGPHSFYWFALEQAQQQPVAARDGRDPAALPLLSLTESWERIFDPPTRGTLEEALPGYLQGCRWFGGKARRVKSATITDTIGFAAAGLDMRIALVQVAYVSGSPETYTLPLAFATGADAARVRRQRPESLVARAHCADGTGVLYDAMNDPRFGAALCDAIARRRRVKGTKGTLVAIREPLFRAVRGSEADALPEPTLLRGEQSNTSVVFGKQLILKLFRRLEPGENPEIEIGRFLSERVNFPHVPPVAGFLTFERPHAEPIALGVLHGFVPNRGDAWRYTLNTLRGYFEAVLVQAEPPILAPALPLRTEPPALARTMIGPYLEAVRLLGQRTAELHLALAADVEDVEFAPEPFSTLYQRALYQSLRTHARHSLELLAQRLPHLADDVRPAARAVLDLRPTVDRRFRQLLAHKLSGMRIRCHGDYHLGQVLHTGKDFVITDFEGEPARSLSERRIKRSPLRDVSGMVRSFHYAAYTGCADTALSPMVRPEDRPRLEPWAQFWYQSVASAFVTAYCAAAGGAACLPHTPEELDLMLEIFMLEKALYELAYELNNRPHWVHIPLSGIRALCEGSGGSAS